MKKLFYTFCLCVILLCGSFSFTTSAAADYTPEGVYQTYIYDTDGKPLITPAAFEVQKVAFGNFKEPSDCCVTDDGYLYICDCGNDRIIISDRNLDSFAYLSSFSFENKEQKFTEPKGVWADNDSLYVADTGNSRIVMFRKEKENYICERIFDRPTVSILEADYQYLPIRLSVDSTGKMYVICKGINQGVMVLDENGEFMNFTGAPDVEPNFGEILWRKIATKEQLASMESYVPTEYNAVTMDKNGFLYVASQTSDAVPVGKLNSDGDNILARPYDGYGDSVYLSGTGYKPYFTDVALYDSGKIGEDIYFVLDSSQGKIYTYSEDGTLLYAFGANGTQKGTFYSASAIEFIPQTDQNAAQLIGTDSFKNSVTVLRETDFSRKIRGALSLYNDGDYEKAQLAFEEIKNIDSAYLPADITIAKMLLYKKDYGAALKKLSVIRRYDLYNNAFAKYRDNLIRRFFPYFLGALFAAVLIFIFCKIFLKKKSFAIESKAFRDYKYANHIMLHPFDGFWDLKHEKRGNVRTATFIAVLFFLMYALNVQFGGYIATGKVPGEENVLYRVAMLFLPLAFYIAANWCFTTLMDGKGTVKDIYIATCYALKPYVIFAIPLLIFSNVITADELAFYTFFKTLIIIWVVFLLYASLMMTPDYSPSKTLWTAVLILVGICIIIFIILLIISIVQNVVQFVYNSYSEISFHSY